MFAYLFRQTQFIDYLVVQIWHVSIVFTGAKIMYQVDPLLQEKALTIATELSEDLQGVTYQVSTQNNTLPKEIAYTCLDICIGTVTVKTCCWSWVISVVCYIFYLLM